MKAFHTGFSVTAVIVLLACRLVAEGPPQPALSAPLPEPYKNYELLPGSVSPDQKLALLNPKRSAYRPEVPLDKPLQGHLYLVSLSPFKILSTFPGDFFLYEGGHYSYVHEWAKNSSAILVTENAKWGPDQIYLATVPEGKDPKFEEMVARVRKLVHPDFKASKAEPFNDNYDFIFYTEYQKVDAWSFNEKGEVVVNCICLTDPKDMDKHNWTVRFQGTWNIARASFTKAEWTRLPWGWEIPQYQKKN